MGKQPPKIENGVFDGTSVIAVVTDSSRWVMFEYVLSSWKGSRFFGEFYCNLTCDAILVSPNIWSGFGLTKQR